MYFGSNAIIQNSQSSVIRECGKRSQEFFKSIVISSRNPAKQESFWKSSWEWSSISGMETICLMTCLYRIIAASKISHLSFCTWNLFNQMRVSSAPLLILFESPEWIYLEFHQLWPNNGVKCVRWFLLKWLRPYCAWNIFSFIKN